MPGLGVLFWNLNRRPLAPRVARLVRAHAPDVVILAECEQESAAVAAELTGAGVGTFVSVRETGTKLQLYDRSGASWRLLVKDQLDAWVGYSLALSGSDPIVLFAAHLRSKERSDEHDQLSDAGELMGDIRDAEQKVGTEHTILVGDMNFNPFEAAAISAKGLHAIPFRDVARREERRVRGNRYSMFYNPMWTVYGDWTPGPHGTYYQSAGGVVNYFWHAFDQVMLRPVLMDRLTALRVLDSDGVEGLLTPGGFPDTTAGSDHLPLFFRLDW